MKLLPQFRDNRFEYWAQMKAQEAHFERLRAALPVIEFYEPVPMESRLLEWKYNPEQPRVPRGDPRGGQWARAGAGGRDEDEAESGDHSDEAEDAAFSEDNWDYGPSSDRGDEGRGSRGREDSTDDRAGSDAEGPGNPRYGEAPDGTPVEQAYDRGTNTRPRELFLTPDGNPVLNRDGDPMMMASDHPPEYFIQKGEEARRDIETAMRLEQPGAAFTRFFNDLYKFRHGGEWDLQRTPGIFDDALRDYSTVAIGMYAAAAGLPEPVALELQNQYARFRSRFSDTEIMEEYYKYLPKRSAWNTRKGYLLYKKYYRY